MMFDNLHPDLLTGLTNLGYTEPTPIQAEAIPILLKGTDLIGQAATGTGKTAAFALPILQRLAEARDSGTRVDGPMGLILTPTRELAMQVAQALKDYGKPIGVRVVAVFGGQPIYSQIKDIRRGVDVVVATPGRALDHIGRKTLNLSTIEMVVLDEADEMLDMGFADDLEAILSELPKERQTLLFSATMPPRVNSIARSHLIDPEVIKIAKPAHDPEAQPKVTQTVYTVSRNHKPSALGRILDMEAPEAAIVFCKTRVIVDQLAETLNGRGYRAEALHGGMSQEQRDRALGKLKNRTSNLLLATDVAARGLDISHLTHVVNFDVPTEPEAYVHRIGRVGRAGREGAAITLSEPREQRLIKNIERVVKQKLTTAEIPSAGDLRSRRLGITEANILKALKGEDGPDFVAMAERLKDEHDLNSFEIAVAALQLLHEATAPEHDEVNIPTAKFRERSESGRGEFKKGGKRDFKTDRPHRKGGKFESNANSTRLYVSGGKNAGMRPKDLVGAIAGEAGVPGSDIGPIEIKESFSLVSVPNDQADRVIEAMKGVNIRGKRLTFRRERF